MGFLSRKTKSKSAVVDEPHPIVEELERMEEAVPERSDRRCFRAPARGSCRGGRTSSSQAAGDVPISTPPAEERVYSDSGRVARQLWLRSCG